MEESAQRSGEGGWGAARADLAARRDVAGAGWAVARRDVGAGWAVARLAGPAAVLHRLGVPTQPRRLLRWCEAVAPALVLGSAEPEAHVDRTAAARAHLDVVRRRSGGASVLVGPGRVAWLDVIVPAGDPLWDDDIGIAPLWLGRAWAAALADLGVRNASVHAGPMERAPWSDYVCFAGTAPGEVRVPEGKVVGISQRRARGGALFQCGALLRWRADDAVAPLALDRAAASAALAGAAIGIADLVGAVGRDDLRAAVERRVAEGAV